LAEVLGADRVAAIDPSEKFVAACAGRVPGIDARVGVAEDLPFADASFDATLAQLVVDGMDDSRRGATEMRRVTKPEGCLLASVWDFDGGMELICTVRDAALDFNQASARSFGAGTPLPFSTAEELEELWRQSGLDEVELGHVEVTAGYESFEDLWSPFAAGIGGLGRFTQSLNGPQRGQFKAQVAERLGNPDGPFQLTARALWVRGRVPS
jgi:SAM-dependent methyltransferase